MFKTRLRGSLDLLLTDKQCWVLKASAQFLGKDLSKCEALGVSVGNYLATTTPTFSLISVNLTEIEPFFFSSKVSWLNWSSWMGLPSKVNCRCKPKHNIIKVSLLFIQGLMKHFTELHSFDYCSVKLLVLRVSVGVDAQLLPQYMLLVFIYSLNWVKDIFVFPEVS